MKPFKNMSELLADHKATMSVSEFERHHSELLEKAAAKVRETIANCEAVNGCKVTVDRWDYDEHRMQITLVMRPVAVTEDVLAFEPLDMPDESHGWARVYAMPPESPSDDVSDDGGDGES